MVPGLVMLLMLMQRWENVLLGIYFSYFFFFSSRRRHTRCGRDWSSDVCSSDLVVLAAFVSPYKKDRENIKSVVKDVNFVEIYINTSLEECERRDVKGLYKKARAGEIKNMTGISAPYEAPNNPDLEIKTEIEPLEVAAQRVIDYVKDKLIVKD